MATSPRSGPVRLARPNTYQGRTAERTFETAYLEYGVMQELVRGTNRRMWFLHDPIEDNPRHDWTDYRLNYIRTLSGVAAASATCGTTKWPPGPAVSFTAAIRTAAVRRRRFLPSTPRPWRSCSINCATCSRPMSITRMPPTASACSCPIRPCFSGRRRRPVRVSPTGRMIPLRATAREVDMLTGFYGLTLPLLKHGIPIRPVQLDNLVRSPGYLDRYRVLVSELRVHETAAGGHSSGLGSLGAARRDVDLCGCRHRSVSSSAGLVESGSGRLCQSRVNTCSKCSASGASRPLATYPCGTGHVIVERVPSRRFRSLGGERRSLAKPGAAGNRSCPRQLRDRGTM